MATFTNIVQSATPSWSNGAETLEEVAGRPIGLLLALTFAATQGGNVWTNVVQDAAPTWANATQN